LLLLFDPTQTAGGLLLLFSVHCAHVQQFMKLLSAAGVFLSLLILLVKLCGMVGANDNDHEAAKTKGDVLCSRTSRKRVFVDCGDGDPLL